MDLIKIQHKPLQVLEIVPDPGLALDGRHLDTLARKGSFAIKTSCDHTPEQSDMA